MQLPRTWYLGQVPGPNYGIVAASSNDSAKPRTALTVVVEPTNGIAGLDQAAATAEETLRAQNGIGDFQRELALPATINGMSGQEHRYRYTLAGKPIRQRTVYVNGQNQIYAISLIAPDDWFAQYQTLFNDILASFKGG